MDLREQDRSAAFARARGAGLTFDGECARRTLDSVTTIGCASDLPTAEPDCSTACFEYHGSIAEGEACVSVKGTPYSDCEQGLACTSGVCTSPCTGDGLKKGELCREDHLVLGSCAEGLVCDADDTDRCVEAAGEGQPCIGGKCSEGLWCQTIITESTCQPKLAAGVKCARDEACESGSCFNGECSTSGTTVDGRPNIGESCDGPCSPTALCDAGLCVAAPPSQRGAAVCSLGVDGSLLEDAGPAGSCSTPKSLPASKDLWVTFPKEGHADTVDGSCARNGNLDMVFAYTPPGDGVLFLHLTDMFLNRGAIFARTECRPLTEDAQTLACDSWGDREEEYLSMKVEGGQALKLVVSDPDAITSTDGVMRLRHAPLPTLHKGVGADTCEAAEPLTLKPAGAFMLARVAGSFAGASDDVGAGSCRDAPDRFFAVTAPPEENVYLYAVAVPSAPGQRLGLHYLFACDNPRPRCALGLGGQASARYDLPRGKTFVLAVEDIDSVGADFELIVATEPK